MINPDAPAFPVPPPTLVSPATVAFAGPGITIRAYFAAMAMQGLLASGSNNDDADIARYAVVVADALILQLNKKPEAKP